MNLNWKKIGLIILFIAAIIILGLSLYYFFFRPIFGPSKPATENQNENQNGNLPLSVNINGRIITVNTNGQLPDSMNINDLINTGSQISDLIPKKETNLVIPNNALFVSSTGNGQFIYYNGADGKFYRVNSDGTQTLYNKETFFEVSNVTWSNDNSKAVLEYPDGSNIIYDFKNNKQITLPTHWEEFDFSPNNNQLVFKSIGLDEENRFLAVVNSNGSGAKTIEPIGTKENQFTATWSPNNQIVGTFSDASGLGRSEIYFIGLNNENYKTLIAEGLGFEGQWSPSGNRMLYSVYNNSTDYQPVLWIASAKPGVIGGNRQNIELNTWANKCTFASEARLLCAVPRELPYGAGIDQSIADSESDDIYEIDLETGAKTLIASPDGSNSIKQIIPVEGANYIMFVNQNNRVYKVEIN